MKCARASNLMSDYVDGELPPTTRLEVELHLGDCPECSRALEDMRRMVQRLGGLSEPRAGMDCWPGVRSAILEHEQRGVSWLSWFARPVAWGSAFALSVLVAVLALVPLGGQKDVPAQNALSVEFKTYMTAHSRLQREHPLGDPDVAFITAEIENASYSGNTIRR
jgi:anti-sigma factor RsiW